MMKKRQMNQCVVHVIETRIIKYDKLTHACSHLRLYTSSPTPPLTHTHTNTQVTRGKKLIDLDVQDKSMYSFEWDPSKEIGGRPDKYRYSTKFKHGKASAGVQLQLGVKVQSGHLERFWMKFSAKFDTEWKVSLL